MAISKIGTNSIDTGAVSSTKLASGVPTRAQMPVGSVLQVVNATYGTPTSNSTTTFATTGLTASITPSSATSKIYINVHMGSIQNNNAGNGVNFILLRNSSTLFYFAIVHGYTNSNLVTVSSGGGTTYLDSPATTSAVSYTVHFASNSGGGQVVITQANGAASSITLMEIAA